VIILVEMYNTPGACRTLDSNYMTPYLIQAQRAEFIELIKIVTELTERKGSQIDVFDIGVGYARIPILLAKIEEIWKCIGKYVGIDISDACLRIAENNVRIHNLSDRVNVIKFDARDLSQLLDSEQRYDLVICTYFTAGNFVPNSFSFDGKIDNLDNLEIKNAFQSVFGPAYNLLRPSGELVLGSVYIDNTSTEERQRQFYENCGMRVITETTPFTATQEGFWSFRFTEKRIKEFFDWIDTEKIRLIPLDTYNFAMMIRINKMESKSLFYE
jgi:SAM-dependent methyltransferase